MKTKHIIIATAVIFIVTVILLFYLHSTNEKEVVQRFQAEQLFASRQLAREIELYLHDRAQGVNILSSFPSLQNRDMKKMTADIQTFFDYVKKDHVKAVSVYEEKGTIIYSTTKEAIGLNYAECDFFHWAIKKENKGKQLVSSLIRKTDDQTVQLPSFRFLIAAPIYQAVENPQHPKPSHNFIGVVTETIDLEEVIAAFLPIASPYAAKENVWIMDRDGTLLFQSEHPEMALKNIRSQDKTCLKCHVTFEHVETILNERQGTTEYQLKDKPKKLASYSSIEFKNISWTIVLNIPYEEVSGFINRNLILTFILIGIIAAVLIGGASLIYRSYRLKALAETEAQQLREKRALEEKIIEFEERYRKLVELLPDGIAIHCEGKIVFANSVIAGLVGASAPEELIGKEAIEMFPPENREVLIERFKRLLESGKRSLIIEDQILRMNGSVSNVDVSAMPISYQNKPAVLLIVHDITRLKRIEETLIRRAEIESAISYISKSMISIRDLDEVINEALEIIGLLAESGRSYIFLISKDGNNLTNTHEWCAQGVEPRKLNLQNIPCNTFPFWMKRFHKNEVINISDVSAMPAEAEAEKEWLTMQNIKSVLVFPLSIANELAGFIGLDNVKSAGLWSEPDINILRTVFESIGIAIERKQAEKALRESEERYRTMVETAHDIVWALDTQGNFTFINRGEELTGHKISGLIGKSFVSLILSEDLPKVQEVFLRTLKGTPQSYDVRIYDIKGKIVVLSVNTVPIYQDDIVVGTVSFGRDITEEKREEEALRKKDEHHRNVIESIFKFVPEGVLVLTESLNLLKHNKAFDDIVQKYAPLLGYTEEELAEKITDQLRSKIVSGDSKEIRIGKNDQLETDVSGRDELIFQFNTARMFLAEEEEEEEEEASVVVSLLDITARKHTEEALRLSEEKFRNIYENLTVGIFRSTPDGKILMANPTFLSILGYDSLKEVKKINLKEHYVEKSIRDKFTAIMMAEGYVYGFEEEWKRNDGKIIYVRESAKAYKDNGEIAYYERTIEDITERKQAEEALWESKHLFHQSEKLAFTGRVAANIAHEVRNPLANVSMSVQQIKKTINSKGLESKHIEIIERNVDRINFLVTELLNSARPTKLNPQTHNIHNLLEEVLHFNKIRINLQRIKLIKTFASREFMLNIDKEQMFRAFTNIINNAIEAMARGGTLTIYTELSEYYISVKIKDTGKGIPEGDILRIFDPFFSTKPKGVGLGLMICHGIIVSHGGTIEVESKPRKGSVFTVSLPIKQRLTNKGMMVNTAGGNLW